MVIPSITTNTINENAKPFFKEGKNEIICLLVHGFTGSPSEVRELGNYLNENGYGVSAPLLEGHGTTAEDMEKTGWKNWYSSVEKEYLRLLKKFSNKIIIPVGLSMGGTLVLHLAYNYNFNGVITLCPGLYFHSYKVYLAPLMKYFIRFAYKSSTVLPYDTKDQFYYNKTPIKSVASQVFMALKVRRELRYINASYLIIQSKNDKTVSLKGAEKIYKSIDSKVKRIIWLDNSGHIITLGQDKEYVFKEIKRFLSDL